VPEETSVTLVTVSLVNRPEVVKALKAKVEPYDLLWLVGVIVSATALTVTVLPVA
jgi:hypothetical protein